MELLHIRRPVGMQPVARHGQLADERSNPTLLGK